MINIHLSGDIVLCPDIAEIHRKAQEIRDKHRICIYNYHEDDCNAWQSSVTNFMNVKKNGNCGRCTLKASDNCPGHLRQKERGKKQKSFKIDNSVYRKISSSAHYLVNESKYKTLFITLTFPPFLGKHKLTKWIFENYVLNQCFSRFVKNLKEVYNCRGYVAVRERGKKSNRVHYHLLLSIPFVPFTILNDYWNNCIKDICHYAKNAVTTDKKTLFIRNPTRALRYVCKYFSKAKNQSSDSRIVFISNDILQKPKQFPPDINFRDVLTGYNFKVTHTSDYTTLFRMENPFEFERFCRKFLYPFFELSIKNDNELYSYPCGPPGNN